MRIKEFRTTSPFIFSRFQIIQQTYKAIGHAEPGALHLKELLRLVLRGELQERLVEHLAAVHRVVVEVDQHEPAAGVLGDVEEVVLGADLVNTFASQAPHLLEALSAETIQFVLLLGGLLEIGGALQGEPLGLFEDLKWAHLRVYEGLQVHSVGGCSSCLAICSDNDVTGCVVTDRTILHGPGPTLLCVDTDHGGMSGPDRVGTRGAGPHGREWSRTALACVFSLARPSVTTLACLGREQCVV